jgi:acetolactate synthase-1/2/3 large subunit
MVLNIFLVIQEAILPIYDELYHWEKANLLKHILVRHEQVLLTADAYARATNKVGLFATSGQSNKSRNRELQMLVWILFR